MKKTLLLLFILATLSALGQVRPPLEANTVRALTELDARKTIKFRTDSLDKAVMAYVEWNANCFRFKRLAAGSAWSSWICAPDEVTLDANAKDVFEIPSGKLTFKSTGKNMALRVDASNKYEFAGTIILNDDYTAFGKNAAVIGYDTVVYGSDTTYVPVYDNVHKNVILLGHNSKASQDSTAFIGDSTIKQLWIAGSLNTKGILLEGDSAYMKHLVLQEADSGKIAKHMGKTIAWVDDDPDSLYFQGAWYVMGLDSISFADSIQINGQWVKFGESLTFPDSIQINGEWVHLGGSVTIAIPDAQTLSWNPDSRQLSISGGNSVTIEDESACSGATGTFYGRDGELITIVNGLVVSIGEPTPPLENWTFKTTSTSSTWRPTAVSNTGATLHWEVTGAATYSVDSNMPVFDFSTPGEKVITITSSDDLVGLNSLELRGRNITEFNSDKLTNLTHLDLLFNELTSFDARGLTALQVLYVSNSQLTSINLTESTGLQSLSIYNNSQLTTVDLTGLTGLQTLDLHNNQLTTIDLTGLTGLQNVTLADNQLTTVDLTGLTGLRWLFLNDNQLTTTAINSILDQLIASGNTTAQVLNATNQTGGGCGDPAKIAALDAIWGGVFVDACAVEPTGYIILKTSSESDAWGPSDVTNSGATLHWEVTGAATYSDDTNLPVFDFSSPGEKIITITSSDDLMGVEYVELSGLEITSFDATGLTGLQGLDLTNNQLTTFDATGLTGLQILYLYNNQLTSFDATGLTGLQSLALDGNQLTSFDATGLTALQELYLNNNQLTTLDATGLTGLQILYLDNNQLTSFDATGLTGLQELFLNGNKLTTTAINSVLDQLITISAAGGYLDATVQVGGGCGDPAKIAALDSIWDKVLVDTCAVEPYIILKTDSESDAWGPSQVTNSGDTLHWEVTGAATYSVDTDTPVFDFSAQGEKIITITSSDNLTGLQGLDLTNNQLTTFDATGLTGLQYLDLKNNQLTSFDATGLTGLQYLDLGNNQLTSLDTTGLTGLQYLYLYNNQFTSFDATGLTGLQYLVLKNNQLTSFDATGLTGLQQLILNSNQLTSFDATGLTGLQYLDLVGNQLTSFDATGLTGLQQLILKNNQLTSFDATGLTGLQELILNSNQLTSTAINTMLDQLVSIGTAGNHLSATDQVGGGCGDPAKIAALDAIWGTVSVDACP